MHMIRDPQTLHLLLDSIRQFVNEALIPRENEIAETDEIPADIVQQFQDMGLFGLTLPEAYGGLGVTMEEEVCIAFELGRSNGFEHLPTSAPIMASAPSAFCWTAPRRRNSSTCPSWPVASCSVRSA